MLKILYVEDNGLMRRAISHKIQNAGYDVMQAGDGIEALAAMKETIPDLVLCDEIMPNMTGSELLAEIRNNHAELDEVPFVIMTAKSERSNLLKGLELGADDYLVKPVDLELLMVKIKSMARLKSRFEKAKNVAVAEIYESLKEQENPDDKFSALFDNLLERLENEYQECLMLKESAQKMKVELLAEKEINKELLARVNDMEGVIDNSLSRLLDIREKVQETKDNLIKETVSSEDLYTQLEEIDQSVKATIIPVANLASFRSM